VEDFLFHEKKILPLSFLPRKAISARLERLLRLSCELDGSQFTLVAPLLSSIRS
jgi:hypothetical protein